MSETRDYDRTVARVAGCVASGLTDYLAVGMDDAREGRMQRIAELSVGVARAIVAEVKRTEPEKGPS